MRDIDLIVLHHTATPKTTTFNSIRGYHMNVRGWSDIFYHFLIDYTGLLYLGRPIWRQATSSRESIEIAVIGNFEHDIVTDEIDQQLHHLLSAWKRHLPEAELKSHQELSVTLCPGANLQNWLDNWREFHV
jgi:N-acetylmuramoyl-L-alanine amidase